MAAKVEAARERLHDNDSYAWTRQQAAHLRARRFSAFDLDHLIEATLELGDVQREAMLSNARVVLEHAPEARAQPRDGPENGWRATVREHRARLELRTTPYLSQALQDELPRVYTIAPCNAEARYATTASLPRPTPSPPPAPTPSTRSPPTGGAKPPQLLEHLRDGPARRGRDWLFPSFWGLRRVDCHFCEAPGL
jgi:hypothetical protein